MLKKVLIIKQHFLIKLINGKTQRNKHQIQTYYFFNDMTNIEVFDSDLLKIDKKSYKNIDIYYIGYITIKKIGDYENIHSANPLYLIIGKVDGHTVCNSVKEKNGSKYLVFNSTYQNRKVFKKYTELWDGIKNKIKTINGGKEGEYGKDCMKIKIDTDDNLPLKEPLKLRMLTIIVRSVFKGGDKLYPKVFLDEYLYEL